MNKILHKPVIVFSRFKSEPNIKKGPLFGKYRIILYASIMKCN